MHFYLSLLSSLWRPSFAIVVAPSVVEKQRTTSLSLYFPRFKTFLRYPYFTYDFNQSNAAAGGNTISSRCRTAA
jgi:hypothetical protein